ncbi:lipopolysaccharide biosynthesis protein [Larkinella soli]|uniref:lipopolysaccharide biosynthesis protein n=1 Tax=Larkinella soli TaxID=1770527 RepID=UPI000FFB8486|nr:hypothetical protein [Larkinella soli]
MSVNLFQVTGTALIQFISVPIFITYWGKSDYGEWLILFSCSTLFQMSDFGINSAVDNQMALYGVRQDYQQALKVYFQGRLLVLLMGAMLLALLLASLFLIDYRSQLHITEMDKKTVALISILLSFHALLVVQQELLSSIYRAAQEYTIGRVWIIRTRLVEFFVVVLAVMFGASCFVVAFLYPVVRLVFWVAMLRACYQKYPWFRQKGMYSVDYLLIKRLLKPSFSFLIMSLGHAVMLQGTLLLAGHFFSPATVVVFSTVRLFSSLIRQGISVVSRTVWIELSPALEQHNYLLARRLHQRASQINLCLAFGAAFIFQLVGEHAIAWWTLGEVSIDQPFFGFMLLATVTYTVWATSLTVPMSVNRHRKESLWFVGSSILGLFCAVLLIPAIGLPALPLGLLLTDGCMIGVVFGSCVTILQHKDRKELFSGLIDFEWLKDKMIVARS